MPRLTRSSELLNIVDGLYFIDNYVIDLASRIYNELRSIIASFGEDAIEKLTPHVVTLFSKLNELAKENVDLKKQVDAVSEDLNLAEHKCDELNTSNKDKAVRCNELPDQCEEEVTRLTTALESMREENFRLKGSLSKLESMDTAKLLAESENKIMGLMEEKNVS
ncbi:uncharacterized protein LOC124355859 [Homalodisca vitripennis]|uniref:uncharacterized protein LOC124355859 n=1 Tax=Homalodisca vitripennis TaxID=197043 RepID=UPI001EEC31A5|nr:uncharacterized protein LOC124355859 [Homalodisca vitripennis]